MKASSLPNLNRETPSFPNFFTFYQDPNDHDDTTIHKRPNIDHSEDTEASETSPFKRILSPSASFNEMNENYYPVGGSLYGWDQMDRTLPRLSPSLSGSDTNVSVGSNQFSGNVGALSEGPNFTNLRWDRGDLDFPEDEFRRAFKMSKSTFNLICTQLESIVDEKDIMLQLALPHSISQRVAVCLWYLATGEPLRLVSKRFGLDVSSCHEFLLDVCYAIENVLMIKYLNWPDEEKMKGIKSEFWSLSGIYVVGVGGSMYTTHVPISAPDVNGHAYVNKRHTERNQKISYTVTVQGVVDSKGIFTDVCIGRPGSMTNDEILETSEISVRANQGLLKNVWIVGNSGYSLRDWVLVPYQDPLEDSTVFTRVFDESVEKVQRVAKEAFRRLKGRWRCLQGLTEVKLQDLPLVLGACCVLHNICEMSNEAMDPADAIFEIFDDESAPEIRVRSSFASEVRNTIYLIASFISDQKKKK